MPPLKIVLDTNALLRCLSRRSVYAIAITELYRGSYELHLSNEILFEYEEKITTIFSAETADLTIGAFALLDNVKKTDIHFRLNIISADTDDNKFIDCAFAANVHFIVTNDHHFNVLKTVSFPVISVITLEQFCDRLLKNQ